MWSLSITVAVTVTVAVVAMVAVWWWRRQQRQEAFTVLGYNSRDIYRTPCPDINQKKALEAIERMPRTKARRDAMKILEKSCGFEATIDRLQSVLTDRDDIFQMSRCISTPKDFMMKELQGKTKADFPILSITPFKATSFNEVRNRVAAEVCAVAKKTREKRLFGTAYALIYQTPYMRSSADPDRMVTLMNTNAASYKYQPMNMAPPNTALLFRVYLFFPSLSQKFKNMERTERAIRCRMRFAEKYKSDDELCFMRCVGEATDEFPSICGCKSDNGQSRCLNKKEEVVDYGILYKLNMTATALEDCFMNDAQRKAFVARRQAPSSGI